MSGLQEQVEKDIRRQRLLRRGQSIVAAVSGGADSMVLLHLLHRLAPAWGWKLTAAHVNHQLRGRSSLADERLVVRVSEKLGLPCVVERVDVAGLMRTERISMEMAARRLRHQFLARAAAQAGCRTIATGHQADDQVEQFFLRLLRGAGPDGLGGLRWRSPSPFGPHLILARPLLGRSRADIRSFAEEHRIQFREDQTNSASDTQRNRIRHRLLPSLRMSHQPALDSIILRQMEILAAEAEFITDEAGRWLRGSDARPFETLPLALQRRCILAQLHTAGIPADFELVERLRLHPDLPLSVNPESAVVRPRGARIRVVPSRPHPSFSETRATIDLGGSRGKRTFDGLQVEWTIRAGSGLRPVLRGGEYFDADRVGDRISLRHWARGDRFQPIGTPASVKLQDWFTNLKIPRARRHQLVVAETAGGDIWWVEGLRIGEGFKVTRATRRRLCWRWIRGDVEP